MRFPATVAVLLLAVVWLKGEALEFDRRFVRWTAALTMVQAGLTPWDGRWWPAIVSLIVLCGAWTWSARIRKARLRRELRREMRKSAHRHLCESHNVWESRN